MSPKVVPLPSAQQKSVTILGATGSIGQSTLCLMAAHPERFTLEAITAGDNVQRLADDAKKYRAKRAIIANPALFAELKSLLQGSGIEALAGEDAVVAAAAVKADIVMSAIVGAAGLKPTLAAVEAGNTVALANKECLVCAGELVMHEAKKRNVAILPVDSEHNAIFQLFDFAHPERIERITLTASGGPFRTLSLEAMHQVTPQQAVKHPNWSMGAKISVDSATLMNKGLELIEAACLFPLPPSQIDILIHPQSVVHGLVQMLDGSALAQMSLPDMKIPIAYALAYPERIAAPVRKLNLVELGQLSFEAPDVARFPALRLARTALEAGGNATCVLNAANEVAVMRFLQEKIPFLQIATIVEKTLEKVDNARLETLEDVLACDKEARLVAERL